MLPCYFFLQQVNTAYTESKQLHDQIGCLPFRQFLQVQHPLHLHVLVCCMSKGSPLCSPVDALYLNASLVLYTCETKLTLVTLKNVFIIILFQH